MILGLSTNIALLLSGILLLNWLFNHISKPLGRILSLIGLPFGVYFFALAIYKALEPSRDNLAIILLALAGITLFAKPLKNIKWAAPLATLLSILLTYFISEIFLNVPLILLFLAFSILTLIIYLVFKFAEDFLQAIGALLNYPPISLALGIICIMKAVSLMIH